MAEKLKTLLLPGINGTGLFFEDLKAAMAEFTDCTVAPLPTEGPQDYASLVEQMSARFAPDAFDVVVAESFSGPLAILLAAQGKLNPRALVLGATFLRTPFAKMPVGLFADIAAMGGTSRTASTPYIRTILLSGNCHLDPGEVWEVTSRLDPSILKERIEVATKVDVREAYAGLRAPILVLNAKQDRLIFALDRGGFAANDNAEVQWLDAPHFLFQCATEDAARSIRHFVIEQGLLAA